MNLDLNIFDEKTKTYWETVLRTGRINEAAGTLGVHRNTLSDVLLNTYDSIQWPVCVGGSLEDKTLTIEQTQFLISRNCGLHLPLTILRKMRCGEIPSPAEQFSNFIIEDDQTKTYNEYSAWLLRKGLPPITPGYFLKLWNRRNV